jgi:hypothetical protein
VIDDLRRADGLSRPALRRAASSLASSRHSLLRRAGASYLRLDPVPPELRESSRPEEAEVLDVEAVEELLDAEGSSRPRADAEQEQEHGPTAA